MAQGKDAVQDALSHVLESFAGMRHKVLNAWRIGDVIILALRVTYTALTAAR